MINLFKRESVKKSQKNNKQARRNVKREAIKVQLNNKVLALVAVGFTLALIIGLLPKQNWLPIEKIRISGNFKYLDTTVIERQLEDYLGHGFFSVDIQHIQQQISQQPWIKMVSVRRVWPDLISVDVKEKQAFARWSQTQLLDNEAVIFSADSSQFGDLPLINGYSGNSEKLLKRYVQLKQQFSGQDITLSEIKVDSKGALTLLLNNQLKVSLGSDHNDQKIYHMLTVYSKQIQSRSQHIEHIDFRYSNGFAIAWKKEYLEQLGQLQRGNKNV